LIASFGYTCIYLRAVTGRFSTLHRDAADSLRTSAEIKGLSLVYDFALGLAQMEIATEDAPVEKWGVK